MKWWSEREGALGLPDARRGLVVADLLQKGTSHRSYQRIEGKTEVLAQILLSLSLSLTHIFMFCRVWEIPVCHDRVCDVPRFFFHKKEKGECSLGIDFRGVLLVPMSDMSTWLKSPCPCNIIQMYMIPENQYNITHALRRI